MFENILKTYHIPLISSIFMFLTLFCNPFLSLQVCAEEKYTTIADLIEHASEFEGNEITISAEVIGDIMDRGSYSWINVLDETSSIGVWISNDKVALINTTGHYKQKGDIVKITGVFNKACKEHGGEADIHCLKIQVMQPGYILKDSLSIRKIMITAFFIVVAVLLSCIYYYRYHKTHYYSED